MLCLDLEYIARDDAAAYLEPVKAPDNYKDPEKIAAYIREKEAKQRADAGLSCDLNQIVVAGWIDDDGVMTQRVAHHATEERVALTDLWAAVTEEWRRGDDGGLPQLVTFCGVTADWPTAVRRSQLLGVEVPACITFDRYRSPLWKGDLAQVLTFGGTIGFQRSLKTYCRLFDIRGLPQDDIDGSEVAARWAAGDVESVLRHNAADLHATRQLACRLL